jgi:hypothetical protein
MGDLLCYLLPREHTSLRRSLVICFVAGLLAFTIQAVSTLIPAVVPGSAGEWLQLIVFALGVLVFWIPMASACIALMRRLGYINTQELTLNAMLVRDYLRGLWPSRTRGKE